MHLPTEADRTLLSMPTDNDLERWLEYITQHNPRTVDMGLARMHTLVRRLDLERPAPQVLTIAGTNGKGSTALASEALLRHAGKLVGTTLSPHLHRYNERFRIDGVEASDAQIIAALQAVDAARGSTPLTYFEFSALAALWLCREERVDVAILEIGLGGRLDAFNAVDADVAVITSIGLDHTDYLGNTRELIGAEKAGVFRAGQHMVLGTDMPTSVRAAAGVGRSVAAGVDFEVAHEAGGWRLHVTGAQPSPLLPYSGMAPHNLALAEMAVRALMPQRAPAWEVLQQVSMPGRLEQIRYAGRDWIVDVAHNTEGVRFLCQQLQHRGVVPDLLVCGMLKDKPHAQVVQHMQSWVDVPWVLLDTAGARGMSGLALLPQMRPGTTTHVLNVSDKMLGTQLLSRSGEGDTILAFGSFDCVARCQSIFP
ncbi:MAG: Mur ligase family protein [Pseudomonadota bacterium]